MTGKHKRRRKNVLSKALRPGQSSAHPDTLEPSLLGFVTGRYAFLNAPMSAGFRLILGLAFLVLGIQRLKGGIVVETFGDYPRTHIALGLAFSAAGLRKVIATGRWWTDASAPARKWTFVELAMAWIVGGLCGLMALYILINILVQNGVI